MSISPRDQIVDPSWWAQGFRDQLVENVAYVSGQVPARLSNDRATRDFNYMNEARLMLWRFDYSAGQNLDTLANEFRAILTSWMRNMNLAALIFELPDLAAIARLFGFDDLCGEFWPGGKFDFADQQRRRLNQWFLGDPDALASPDYWFPATHKPSKNLRALIDKATNAPGEASDDLERYVRQQWYRSHKGAPWWGSHSRNGTPHGYLGYWCFAAAAVARICGVDDSGLEGHKYYPYALAHYLD